MIVRRDNRVVVQGMTGRQGRFWTERMIECGTNVVAGVSPGKGGQEACGRPVYGSAADAQAAAGFDTSVLFVPPAGAKAASLDAIAAGARLLVMLTEHVPVQDVMEIMAAAKAAGCRIVGPNTAGLVTPGEGFVGIMPGFNDNIFRPGDIGVVSRSGSLGTLISLNLVAAGHGQSAFIGIGGDPIIGTSFADALAAFEADPGTRAVVMVGEIGGALEEAAAAIAAGMSKPVLAFIAGRSAPPGKRMGHAGAIVAGNAGSYDGKRQALEAAGVSVLDLPSDVGPVLQARLDALQSSG